jgi:Tfp pilus assembly pilus retraction ATPase PilT
MLNLSGLLEIQSIRSITDMVSTKFKDSSIFRTPESVILYEQGYLTKEQLLDLCNTEYENLVLEEPTGTFMPKEIIEAFRGSNAVPIRYLPSKREVQVLYVEEYPIVKPTVANYKIVYVPTTLHYYILNYTRFYGAFQELLSISGKVALDMVLEEAIKQGVPDLTISNEEERVIVYYNKKKRKIMGNNIFPRYIMEDILKVLTIGTPIADLTDNRAKYVGFEIDDEYRARVVINKNLYGNTITIRIFPNSIFDKTLEDLNINQEVIDMFRNSSINRLNGLRIIVGETMSGKNHTALAVLREIVNEGGSKVVSIEMPVEQRLLGVEQIGTEYIEEYVSNIESLIHQNPDFVYITETKDETGSAVMKIANTGKRVLTTLHSNSIADTISRVTDITGLSANRVIQVLHSVIHQELVRVGEEIYPKTTFVYFDDDFKQELYDKPFGEVIKLIRDREKGGFRDGIL